MFSSDIWKRVAMATLAVATLTANPVAAQIPEEFTNLQLLPKDIEQRKLVRTMRDWAGGLGVRCNHCHVGPENLQGMDFASDEKRTKRAARKMLGDGASDQSRVHRRAPRAGGATPGGQLLHLPSGDAQAAPIARP